MSGGSWAQSANDGFDASTDGVVTSLALQPDGKILLGGEFTALSGRPRSNVGRLNADGSLDTSFNPGANSRVRGFAVQADGKILVGGAFSNLGGAPRNNIGRLNADGSIDRTFDPHANADVNSIAVQPDGKMLVGGAFPAINQQLRARIARLNFDGSVEPGFNPGANGEVLGIVTQPDGKVLVAGRFTSLGGKTRNGIGRLMANGLIDANFDPNANGGSVTSVAVQADGKVLVGGDFTTLKGQVRNGLGRLNADGSIDASFNPAVSGGGVMSLAIQPDGKVLVGGRFDTLGGQPRNGIGRLNVDGSVDSGFNSGVGYVGFPGTGGAGVASLVVQPDGRVIAGGDFNLLGGQTHSNIGRLYADGSLEVSLNAGITYFSSGLLGVRGLAIQPDSKALVGGFFTGLAGQQRNYIGRLNADGSLDTAFDPAASFLATAFAILPDGKVVVGGWFDALGRKPRIYIGRLRANGALDPFFDPGANGFVLSISAQPDGKILVGGDFQTLGGVPRSRIGRLKADGSIDSGFNPGADDRVNSIATQVDGKVLVAGNFNTLGGVPRHTIGRLHANGSLDTEFNPSVEGGWIENLVLQPDGKILVGGSFTTLGGLPRNGIGRLKSDGSLDREFDPGSGAAGGAVMSLALQPDGKVLLGGSFTSLGGQARSGIGRLNADGSLDSTFNIDADGRVWGIALQPDGKVLLGGTFTAVGGQTRNGIARLSLPEAALQNLVPTADLTGLRWLRSGAGPEVGQVRFAVATSADAPESEWTDLGAGTRIVGGWSLNGLNLPYGVPLWVRAQGTSTGGLYNGSQSLVRSVRMLQRPLQPPDAPSNVVATVDDGKVSVSWSAPDAHGSPLTGYRVTGSPGAITCPVVPPATGCTIFGLDNGTAYTFTVTATNAVGESIASAPVTATPQVFINALVSLPGSGGTASVQIGGAPVGCTLVPGSLQIGSTPPPGTPVGTTFPQGIFSFEATGCDAATLTIAITYPTALDAAIQLRKYGPQVANAPYAWFTPTGATISPDRRTVSFTVTDDGEGDSNPVRGAIRDPFAPLLLPVVPVAPTGVTSIPTLSEWGLALLSLLMAAVFGVASMRRPPGLPG